ncbi:MAG: HIT family protein [Candidatus Atribacteria bacterium]|jgi:histidine triad (HIT) family protein|nr:HIT family protein [Candidatus Atribacteria bacterium]
MSEQCVFCQIIRKEKEAYLIHEDEQCIAFLDAYPVTEGHTLVIPKGHYQNIYEIPEDTLAHIMKICKRLALDYQQIFQTVGLNIIQSNGIVAKQTVFHFHVHLVPRYYEDGLTLFRHAFTKSESNLTRALDKITAFQKEKK